MTKTGSKSPKSISSINGYSFVNQSSATIDGLNSNNDLRKAGVPSSNLGGLIFNVVKQH